MVKYVKVRSGDSVHCFPLKAEDGPLELDVLNTAYPSAQGLLLDQDGDKVVIPSQKGLICPGPEGWGDHVFSVLTPEPDPAKGQSLVTDKLLEALAKPRTQLVMSPERKITPFDGKPSDVEDFLISIKDAYQRYSVPTGQRGAFLVDYLRGVPKSEVKALLASGQTVDEVLTFLKNSYGEKLAVGELQRLFLERKQRQGEGVRDYAVDLERRFLRLTRRDPKLYSSPNAALTEQFIEGLGDTYIRNTCRDLYEAGTVTSFRELREYVLKREGQEEARCRATTSGSSVHSAAMQMGNKDLARSDELLAAIKEMTDRVVTAVQDAVRPSAYHLQGQMQSPNGRSQPDSGSSYSRRSQMGPRGACYACGSMGHFVRHCPYRNTAPYRNQGQQFAAGSGPPGYWPQQFDGPLPTQPPSQQLGGLPRGQQPAQPIGGPPQTQQPSQQLSGRPQTQQLPQQLNGSPLQ